jgi:hypothetical protein
MRKRELLIIAAFVVMGVIAYQLTAAPPSEGRRGFSLGALMDEIRRETGGGAMAAVTTEGTVNLPSSVSEVRISGVPHLIIRGGARTDIAYTLRVEANGRSEGAARASAARTRLSQDLLGDVLGLRANVPREGRHRASLSLIVPSTLRLRVEGIQGGATLEAADISEMHLDGVVGDVRLSGISGTVAGTHRNGEISVTNSATVDLVLQNSETTIDGIREAARLSVRNGRSMIANGAGPIEVNAQNEEILIRDPLAGVRVTGIGGSVEIADPRHEASVDMRRAAVVVTLAREVALTILTTDAPLRLNLVGHPPVRLDAIATDGGTISAESLGVTPEAIEQEMRLAHAIAGGTVTVALRNRRGAIVIGRVK